MTKNVTLIGYDVGNLSEGYQEAVSGTGNKRGAYFPPGFDCWCQTMTFKEHCEESIRLFGKPYEELHRWLDEFMGAPGLGARHRKIRHHEAGIREAVKLFGQEAGKVAKQHIISDVIDPICPSLNDKFLNTAI